MASPSSARFVRDDDSRQLPRHQPDGRRRSSQSCPQHLRRECEQPDRRHHAGERNIISGFEERRNRDISGIRQGATGNVIQGNYIGTDATGTVALSRVGGAIEIRGATNNTIGGTTAAARNIISGNGAGISIVGGSSNIRIQGNYIGTNSAGDAAVPNRFAGRHLEGASNNTIGGTAPGAGNVISGNGTGGNDHGIRLGFSTGGVVQGNCIGTNAAGTAALGNGGAGIQSLRAITTSSAAQAPLRATSFPAIAPMAFSSTVTTPPC